MFDSIYVYMCVEQYIIDNSNIKMMINILEMVGWDSYFTEYLDSKVDVLRMINENYENIENKLLE